MILAIVKTFKMAGFKKITRGSIGRMLRYSKYTPPDKESGQAFYPPPSSPHKGINACQLLRDENWQASTISIKLRYSDFVTITRAKTIKPTDDDKVVFDTAVDLFRKAFTRRVSIRLIGIHLSKLSHICEQEVLFEDEEIIRKRMLRAVMKIRGKYGRKAIHIGIN